MVFTRKQILFMILTSFFVANAVIAEVLGIKMVSIGITNVPIGILLWPIVFLTTDLLNEFYGKKAVRTLSFITAGLIVYLFLILTISIELPGQIGSVVSDENFKTVFGASRGIQVGSVLAFLVSQLLDVFLFWFFYNLTKGKYIWIRATGSTLISQLFDTFIIQGIAFYLPGLWTFDQYIQFAFTGYVVKICFALILIPFIYLGHYLIRNLIKE